MNEADTCRKYVVPKLQAAGWENDPHSLTEQKSFTDGRIVVFGNRARRQAQKRADYLLRYTRDFPIAVVEAKAAYKSPSDGLQQAKDYATVLGLKLAYATNGHGIVEFDFLTGLDASSPSFRRPRTSGLVYAVASSSPRKPPSGFSRRATASSGRRPAITRRSPSTVPCSPSYRGRSASCSRWRPARARP